MASAHRPAPKCNGQLPIVWTRVLENALLDSVTDRTRDSRRRRHAAWLSHLPQRSELAGPSVHYPRIGPVRPPTGH